MLIYQIAPELRKNVKLEFASVGFCEGRKTREPGAIPAPSPK